MLKAVRDEKERVEFGILCGRCSSHEAYRSQLAVITALNGIEDRMKTLISRYDDAEPPTN